MLTRYWQWTSGPAAPAESGLPFGPLRYRAWTSGASVVVVVPGGGGAGFGIRIDDNLTRFALQRDDELMLFVAAAIVTLN